MLNTDMALGDMQELENFCFPFDLWYHPWDHSKLWTLWSLVQNKNVGSFIQIKNFKMVTTKHESLLSTWSCVTTQTADSWSQPHMAISPKLSSDLHLHANKLQKTWEVVTKAQFLVNSMDSYLPTGSTHNLFICHLKMNKLLKIWHQG